MCYSSVEMSNKQQTFIWNLKFTTQSQRKQNTQFENFHFQIQRKREIKTIDKPKHKDSEEEAILLM